MYKEILIMYFIQEVNPENHRKNYSHISEDQLRVAMRLRTYHLLQFLLHVFVNKFTFWSEPVKRNLTMQTHIKH